MSDAEAITKVHDAAWRYAYDGVIPAQELARIIARRGPRWWARAIRRGTAVLVMEVAGEICGYATFGPNRARNLAQKGGREAMVVEIDRRDSRHDGDSLRLGRRGRSARASRGRDPGQ